MDPPPPFPVPQVLEHRQHPGKGLSQLFYEPGGKERGPPPAHPPTHPQGLWDQGGLGVGAIPPHHQHSDTRDQTWGEKSAVEKKKKSNFIKARHSDRKEK